jgi:hypothetical protein
MVLVSLVSFSDIRMPSNLEFDSLGLKFHFYGGLIFFFLFYYDLVIVFWGVLVAFTLSCFYL